MSLPVHQVCKGQPRPAELLIQPDTEVMQGDLCCQTCPKPAELMGSLPVQAKGMKELVVDRLDDLPDPRPPATQRLWPWGLAIPLGRTEDLSAGGLPPLRLVHLPLKALVDDIGATGGGSHARQPRMGLAAHGKEGVRQRLVFGARRAKGKAGDHSYGVDRQEEMQPFIPTQAVAPANIG